MTTKHSLSCKVSVKSRAAINSGEMRNRISSWTHPRPITPPPTILLAKSTYVLQQLNQNNTIIITNHQHLLFWKRRFLPHQARVGRFAQGRQPNLWQNFKKFNSNTSGKKTPSASYPPMGIGASFWGWDALPNQPVGITEETLESRNLFSGSWISTSVPN